VFLGEQLDPISLEEYGKKEGKRRDFSIKLRLKRTKKWSKNGHFWSKIDENRRKSTKNPPSNLALEPKQEGEVFDKKKGLFLIIFDPFFGGVQKSAKIEKRGFFPHKNQD